MLRIKSVFQACIEDIRVELDDLDSGCNYVHHDDTTELDNQNLRFSELRGHSNCCELPLCSSPLRVIRTAATHYPILIANIKLASLHRKKP